MVDKVLNHKYYGKKANPKTRTRILDPDPEQPGPLKSWTPKNLDPEKLDPEKPGLLKTWTLKNIDPEKYGGHMGFKNISDFRELFCLKTMRNVICCLKFTDI